MMQFLMLAMIAAMDATQLQSSAIDHLQRNAVKGFASPAPQNPADAANSAIDDIMAQIQPELQKQLTAGIIKFQKGVAVNIDVSPTIPLKLKFDLAGLHSSESNVAKVEGDAADVIDGAMVVAEFQDSLHDNNNVVGQGDVERLNGVGIEDTDESTSSMMSNAMDTVSPQSSSSLLQVKHTPPSLLETLAPNATDSFLSTRRKSSADGVLSIRVSPHIKLDVITNLKGAYSNNKNVVNEKGRVQRVVGAMVVANFSGALHDNNMALSLDGEAQRINGADVSSSVDMR